jgi:hypothetical protein
MLQALRTEPSCIFPALAVPTCRCCCRSHCSNYHCPLILTCVPCPFWRCPGCALQRTCVSYAGPTPRLLRARHAQPSAAAAAAAAPAAACAQSNQSNSCHTHPPTHPHPHEHPHPHAPATCVPCPTRSCCQLKGQPAGAKLSSNLQPSTASPRKSGWPASSPAGW